MAFIRRINEFFGFHRDVMHCESCGWVGSIRQAVTHELDSECNSFRYRETITIRSISMQSFLRSMVIAGVTLGVLKIDPGEYETYQLNLVGLTRSRVKTMSRFSDRKLVDYSTALDAERRQKFLDRFDELIARRWSNCGHCSKHFVPFQDLEFIRVIEESLVSLFTVGMINNPSKTGVFCSIRCENAYRKDTMRMCAVCQKKKEPKSDEFADAGVCSEKCHRKLDFAHSCRSCQKVFMKKEGQRLKQWHQDGFCSKRCAANAPVLESDELLIPEYSEAWETRYCAKEHPIDVPLNVNYPYRFFCSECQRYLKAVE